MRQLTVGPNDDGQRLDRFLKNAYPHLPSALWQRWLREKRVRLQGKHQPPSARVCTGDIVALYIADDKLDSAAPPLALPVAPQLDIVYEDTHLLIVNKPAGLSVHADEHAASHTLVGHVQAYCRQSGAWDPARENGFAPSLAHRLDKNTSGLVIAAKTAPALRLLNERIALRQINKRYLCLVVGKPSSPSGELTHYLRRDEVKKQVSVFRKPVKDARTAVLRYNTLSSDGQTSLLEIELLTGRTHQIRAQMAFVGHPLVGDGKYGKPAQGYAGQALCAYSLTFNLTPPAPPLDYIIGKTFTLRNLPPWAAR